MLNPPKIRGKKYRRHLFFTAFFEIGAGEHALNSVTITCDLSLLQ